MHVLHAYKVYRPDVDGGIPEVIAKLTQPSSSGDKAEILVARDRGWPRRFVLDGCAVRAVGSLGTLWSMPIAPGFAFALHRAASRFDVLALHAPFPLNDLGVALGVPDDVAVVVHWHADILGRGLVMPVLAPLIRRTLDRADRIIVSHPSILNGSAFLEPHAAKCVAIPYGVQASAWQQTDETVRRRIDELKHKHPRLIVAIGRLVPYKGFAVLLQAMTKIDAEVVIIGEGSERADLEALAQQLGVADRVMLPGFLPHDEMKAYLHAAKVFALPSVTAAEAFGLVQIEAMAVGLPVVNTALPTAVPTIARHGSEGLTVPVVNPDALANAITRLLDDPELATAYGQAGRRRVSEVYDHAVFQSAVRDIYQATILRRGRGVSTVAHAS
ncbi:glycosyl transferase family 1 [Rhodopseudomonas palustris]|uniref:Glycosyl transferase family 1 n=1 Tax=Rhodopseudomonas palustris TaxID=1076 RepID=A0A323UD92_RHOPL|nr:glycosyltransferase [Rhodopseudomonas palustris]PZA09400.1 glycosyl transferase family 1 [Rhodopseudomonas palustris]